MSMLRLALLMLCGLWAGALSTDDDWKESEYGDDEWEGDEDELESTGVGSTVRAFKNGAANASGDSAAAAKTSARSGSTAAKPKKTSAAVAEYDSSWKEIVTGGECVAQAPLVPKNGGASGGVVVCKQTSTGGRVLTFPAGKFDIDEQVVVPANTEIVGNANPVDPEDKEKEPDIAEQTYFIATRGLTDGQAAYCGTGGNMGPGDAEALRIGFLLNSNTTVRYISYQGVDKVRPDDNGNLCGGGVFETPGCVSPGFGDGVGGEWVNKRNGCYDHTGQPNDLILGDGKGVENVVVDSVRLNGLLLPEDGDFVHAMGSQVAVWVAMTQDGSATRNVRITNLVSMFSRGDGINLHGNVKDSVVEDCLIANTGDDAYAAWGAYAEWPGGNIFRNNVAKNVGVARDYGYGVCMAIYGARDVTVTGMRCIDLGPNDWNPQQEPEGNDRCNWGPNCNSALAIIHDGWFGAVYPPGNTINIYDNEYVDFDGNPITEDDRPQVRLQGNTAANLVSTAPPIQELSMLRRPIDGGPAHNSSPRSALVGGLAACAVSGLVMASWALFRGRSRAASAERRAGPRAVDSGSSAAEGSLLMEAE